MGSHPINLGIRFLLELVALFSAGLWGWRLQESWWKYVLAIGIPVLLAVIWGTFAVPDDPSRSGNAPVAVPGMLRLVIELGFFAFATWTLYDIGYPRLSWVLGIIVVLHYLASYDRISWLLAQ